MSAFGTLNKQYDDDNGDPLSNGVIYFYEPGTTTDKTVYTTQALSVAHTQPVSLDANGRQPSIYFSGQAKAVLKTAVGGATVSEYDYIGDAAQATGIADYDDTVSYDANDIIKGDDDLYYMSLVGSNVGNNPTAPSPSYWMLLRFVSEYNASYSYLTNDITISGGRLWMSLQDANQGNTPALGSSFWFDLSSTTRLDTTPQTGSFNAADGVTYLLNGSLTATLPAPAVGKRVGFVDYAGDWATDLPVVARNGTENIQGQPEDMTLDVDNAAIILTYIDATTGWKMVPL